MAPATKVQDFRIFVATWNVGGKAPNNGMNLEDFLQVEGSSDMYVLGFQEIVPLNAGNVLVNEDNEPPSKWIALIGQALNRPREDSYCSSSSDSSKQPNDNNNNNSKDSKSHFFQKASYKALKKTFKVDSSLLKTCNCPLETTATKRQRGRAITYQNCRAETVSLRIRRESSHDDLYSVAEITPSSSQLNYRLVASKQMVGIFLSVWVRKEMVQHVAHLRISCVGRGIMGYLGNKGCISISMSLHQTNFCFVCSHLASGEKEGDELRRNSDVAEILKSTQFPRICKNTSRGIPEKIIDHERVIWLGDLNYRVSLSYEETRVLLEENNWDALLEKDQLKIEREAGRVFTGWNEGKIFFAPTYKYSHNSDSYAGETAKSKKKRRTPAWCDRILWHGKGIELLSYIRGESRFSDHRPVCAIFVAEVKLSNNDTKFRKGFPTTASRMEFNDFIPQRHSFYEF